MMQMIVNEYASAHPDDAPALFSRTSDFRFFDARGRLVHQILPTGTKGYLAIHVTSTGHQASHEESQRLALTLPIAGFAKVDVGGKEHRVTHGDAILLSPSQRHSGLFPGLDSQYESFTVLAPPSLTTLMTQEDWRLRPAWNGAATAHQLFHLAYTMAESGRPMTRTAIDALEALIEDVFHDMLDIGQAEAVTSSSRNDEIVQNAVHFMREHYQVAISMTQVAQHLDIGTRCMQLAFHDRLGKSPKRLLAEIRLDALRRQLLSPTPETTVTSAAMASGLFHLGRVSQAYSQMFGELPSETLTRMRT